MKAAFIALDWGTSSFRAYLADAEGRILEKQDSEEGILSVEAGDFEAVFERHVARWDDVLPVIASGMITSRQGWVETPYCECPAGLEEIVERLRRHQTRAGWRIAFVPGVSCRAPGLAPDVMRGEETQIFGASGNGLFVLPGTHSKWARVRGGRIESFMTFMTGEVFAALKEHSILGRLMREGAHDEEIFGRGVAVGLRKPELLLHTLFSTRTLGLFAEIRPEALASYLSGLLIGAEIGGALPAFPHAARVEILASEVLAARYIAAFALAQVSARAGDPDVAVAGLARIGKAAGLIP